MGKICETIKNMPSKIWKSLALDQGLERMNYSMIERQTQCKMYFCDHHSPWQNG